MHNITITNKEIRDTIQQKLRQQLIISFLINTNFNIIPFQKIYQILRYCKGFIKENTIDNENLKKIIFEALQKKLKLLPDTPNEISDKIKQMLLFKLPIKKRSQTRAVVAAIHKVFKFETLLQGYFITLNPLLEDPSNLHPSIRDLFPITNYSALRDLTYYKRKLQDHYKFSRIQNEYFDLLLPKQPLLFIYQELNPKV